MLALSPTDGKIKWGFQYTPNDPYDFDEISEHPIINAKVNGEDRKLVVHAARNGFYYALDRINGSFVAGKQYVDELTWTTGLDPKTGKPLNYDPTKDVQVYAPGSHGMRGAGRQSKTCPSHGGGKNWQPSAYNPELNLLYLPTIEGCNSITTVEQKDFVDQGGTREAARALRRRHAPRTCPRSATAPSRRSIPPTGETKAQVKLTYPNWGGALATAGNLVFNGAIDGTFYAFDAQDPAGALELQRRHRHQRAADHATRSTASSTSRCWSARSSRSRRSADFPELKNTSTASMLYVFEL